MKSNVMPSIVQMEAKELEKLVTEVKETMATEMIRVNGEKAEAPQFRVIDMWKIHRNMRSAHLQWRSVL